MKLSNVKWIFFDLGWTLVDETEAHRSRLHALRGQLERLDKHYSIDELVVLCEQSASDFVVNPFQGVLKQLGLSPIQINEVGSYGHYAKGSECLYPRVPELLATLFREYKLGIIANQSIGTEKRLSRWGIKDYFTIVFASAEFGLSKPDPKIFAAALSEADCTPEEALMVGDRLDNDIGPAKAQGWCTTRVLQGFSRYQKPRNEEEIPDITISTIQELINYMPRL